MTRTEVRLADALDAAARAVREDTLNPLTVPECRRGARHGWVTPVARRSWVTPVAAAAGLLLVVGLGVAFSRHFSATGHAARPVASPAGPPPPYYVESDTQRSITTDVRATATGAVTATVPEIANDEGLSAAADGEFFALGSQSPEDGIMLYRFGLTSAGQVTGLSPVPGGTFPYGDRYGAYVDAVAASPDGSEFAAAVQTGSSTQIVVINTVTGARSVWQGGIARPGVSYGVINLSWTSTGELVLLAHRCSTPLNGEMCPNAYTPVGGATPSDFQVWELDPEPEGGQLHSGRMLLSGSARFPAIAQALISPDGSTLTAVVVNQQAGISALDKPGRFSVDQISVASGTQLTTLYQGGFADSFNLSLSSDGTGQHWLINGSGPTVNLDGNVNAWIEDGKLTALKPANSVDKEAWSAGEPSATPNPVPSPDPGPGHAAARHTGNAGLLRRDLQRELSQALISGDGSSITAMVVTGPPDRPAGGPLTVSVKRIPVSTGTVLSELYSHVVVSMVNVSGTDPGRRDIMGAGYPVPLLSSGPASGYWLLDTPCSALCPKPSAGSWEDGGLLYRLPSRQGRETFGVITP
jgi:hypothetical protein